MLTRTQYPKLNVGIEPLKAVPLRGGWNWLFQFENGYGASVVQHDGSYGHEDDLYELLLTKTLVPGEPGWEKPPSRVIRSMQRSLPGMDSYGLMGWLPIEDLPSILGTIRGYGKVRRS